MSKRGENIYKRKDGRWEGRYVKCRTLHGKIQYGYVYGKSYSETKAKLKENASAPIRSSSSQATQSALYDEVLKAWLLSSKNRVKESTFSRYNHLVERHIQPLLGRYPISEISTVLLEECIDYLLQNGRLDGSGGLSPKSVSDIIAVFASTVLIAALGTLFQWIYGLHYDREPTEPTAYIFVIDDSGSMESNDPDQLRYAAVNKVLEKKPADFPYMIYGFSTQVSILREMMPISDGAMDITGNNRGGTCIKKVMNQVIADYQNHVWEGGEHPKVILFTDGHASDVGWFSSINKALKQFSKNHISVSAVGLGAVYYALMQKITAKTGGVFIDISDAAMLGDAMEDAANQYAADDLLTTRYSSRLNFLFGFLRILFLTILGACIGSVCAVTYGKTDAADFVILTSVIQSFAGALLMELLTSMSGLSDRFCWFVLWMFIAAMLCTQNSGYRRGYARPSRGRGKSSSVLR